MRRKVALVVQRYGTEVNGGAEFYARLMSEKLNSWHEIEVLTTCALDYAAWESYYQPGREIINGVVVRRFKNYNRGYKGKGKKAKHAFQQRKWHHRLLKALKVFRWLEKKFSLFQPTTQEAHDYLENQGPHSPELIEYIKTHQNDYDAFVFVTYLYHPTAVGLFPVKGKSIFIPTAHDEPAIYSPYFRGLFAAPKWIFYLTEAERKFCETLFSPTAKSVVVGVGIDIPAGTPEATAQVREKYQLPDKYILYMGRVDKSKGCDELFAYYLRYKAERKSDVHLVVAGKSNIKIPDVPTIRHLGFVAEEEKEPLLRNSLLCIIPSRYESLSLIALESYAVGKSILVNGKCEVLKQHVQASGAGKYYYDYREFKEGLDTLLLENPTEATKGKAYIQNKYSWAVVIERFNTALEGILTLEQGKVESTITPVS